MSIFFFFSYIILKTSYVFDEIMNMSV